MTQLDTSKISQHISQQFNVELEDVRQRVLTMGGLVERQITDAIRALTDSDGALGQKVAQRDVEVNAFEVGIDEDCTRILARRQPTAGDLRLVVAIIKTITDLERIGDEAEKIARLAATLASEGRFEKGYDAVENLSRHVRYMVRDALDAFARMDTEAALKVAKEDAKVDREHVAILRQCVTYMMEDPRTISRVINLMWCVRALERMGDHASNIAEYVIYLVEGKDIRHTRREDLDEELEKNR